MRDLKYLLAYIVPLLVGLSLYLRGPWSYLAVFFVYGLIPLAETFLPGTTRNLDSESEAVLAKRRIFDWLLYLNLPIVYALVFYFLYTITTYDLVWWEWLGLTVSTGIACGALGINVGHELGHRIKGYEKLMAQGLLLSSLYLHFFIEHNRGHHKNVATPLDPATARKGESLYAFWWRSISGSFLSAWQLEAKRLKKAKKPVWSWSNLMIRFQVAQVLLVLGIGLVFGWFGALSFVLAALVGILELETVNYLEHYGLLRKETRPGVFERVRPQHSWNSNRTLGRILLYELTRHSDHHYLASRKYQVLRHFEESPELPNGYPAMMLLSLVPPLWFQTMDRRLNEYQETIKVQSKTVPENT